ncbi:MAG: hypothetical protein VYE77_04560 [Planctomycetota bacterium]|nr:hypothetical protein [Planctomycetota bacterium]
MARSRRKAHGTKRGRFKRKRMGKGWLTVRRQPGASRPVLRITESDEAAEESKAAEQQD